jgi:hypothetical protein
VYAPAISRLSTTADETSNSVRIAYQAKNAHDRQEYRVIAVSFTDPKQPPAVRPVKTIQAEDPAGHSVMYCTFIDPDYVDMPKGVTSNASVLYWLEAPKKEGLWLKTYVMRYSVLEGMRCSEPAHLSVEKGNARRWPGRADLGDYMSGGFFWKDNALHYLPQWVEPEGIKGNLVSLEYKVTVPDCGNLTRARAGALLRKVDLKVGKVTVLPPEPPPGKLLNEVVVEQDPAPGESVRGGTAVALVLQKRRMRQPPT